MYVSEAEQRLPQMLFSQVWQIYYLPKDEGRDRLAFVY